MPAEAMALKTAPTADAGAGPAESSAEKSLLARAQAGESQAFEALMLLHERRVVATALRLLGNRDDARDASQEVFLKLFRHLRSIDPERSLAAWLYRVTVNVCRDFGRRRRGRGERLDPDCADASTVEGDADRRLILAQEWRFLQQALAELPEMERAAIVLRDIEELETREVAGILGTSEVTVRSQICRARMRIRRYLERALGGRRP